ncbi:MAG TPA: glycosyltransferase family 4 protein [Steroidobacteraceae bacterium]|nr:glycosyltransferase family 4 protein [Steroidobacteraceae bacterium]
MSPVRVMVLGVRGIPAVQGGIETHAEQLYERLANLGCEVEVLVRTPFVPSTRRNFGSVRIRRIWSPTARGYETLVHSLLGVLYAGLTRPDVLHIHAIGPAIVTPIARLLGLRVVVTNHGPDYDRDKWGPFPKWVLRTGESLGMRFAHARISISRVIEQLIQTKYGRESDLIPNGAVPVNLQRDTREIERFGLTPGRYFVQVSRIVPEKRQLDLIQAFSLARPPGWKLVLVGRGGSDAYSQKVEAAAKAAGVVLAGFQRGAALAQLYTHAGAFVLPSSHEGLPIAILEALSYGLPVLASDIPANREIGLNPSTYFPVGDVRTLAERLTAIANAPQDDAVRDARRRWVIEHYNWGRIAQQTHEVYSRVMREHRPLGRSVI